MKRISAVFILLVMQVGCGSIKLPGLQVGGAEGSESGPGSSGGGEEGERTKKLYQELTYANVSATSADAIFTKAGIPTGYNPRRKTENPDATWIPRWDGLELTDETKTAIAQAAINRSWTGACHKAFDTYYAGWKKIAAAHRAELDSLSKTGNYYDRAAGLATLLGTAKREAEDAKVFYKDGALAGVGFLNDIVQAMAKLHHETKRDFIGTHYFSGHEVNPVVPVDNGRPFAEAEDERDLFCAAAQKSGAGSLPALPVLEEYGKAFRAVRWPVAMDRKAALAEKRDALVAASRAARSFVDAEAGSLANGSLPGKTEPKLYRVYIEEGQTGTDKDTPFKVTAVSKSGANTVVEAESTRERLMPYDCKNTSQIDRIENGTVYYVKDCKYQAQVTTRAVTVEFPELPSNLEIKAGDVIGFYGDLLEKNEPKGKGTSDKQAARATFRFAGRYLEVLKRDKLVVKPF